MLVQPPPLIRKHHRSQRINQTNLPLSMDSLLVLNTGLHRRHLGENFDERIQQRHQSFVVTADNRFIISTGYWDKSFRVQNTDMAKTTQVLYGHFDIVTCACRSEVTIAGNCFLATGSRDSTVCIWVWNGVKRSYPWIKNIPIKVSFHFSRVFLLLNLFFRNQSITRSNSNGSYK